MPSYRLIDLVLYKASINVKELYPFAYIEVADEKLRDKWVKSYRKSYGKDAPIELSEIVIQIQEEIKEVKVNKGEDTA